MRVRCNHRGGVGLPGLRIPFGETEIDAEAWKRAVSVNPAMAKAYQSGAPPMLELLLDDSPEPEPETDAGTLAAETAPTPATEPEPDETRTEATYCPSLAMKATDAAAQIADMTDLAALERFVKDDNRKTIVQAATRKRTALIGDT